MARLILLAYALTGHFAPLAKAQSLYSKAYTFTTLAGDASGIFSADGIGNNARFYYPSGVAVDSAGNIYVADKRNNTIRKVTAAGVVTTLAGEAGNPGNADGTGNTAQFYYPSGVAVDSVGNLYVTDTINETIRKVTATGVVTTLSGPGNDALLVGSSCVAVDRAGNLYVNGNETIQKITPVGTNWVVASIAGLAFSYGSADGTNSTARFYAPAGIAVDSATNIYVADQGNYTIRKITPSGTNWVVSTIAGLAGFSGTNDGSGEFARFSGPVGITVDINGDVYVTDDDAIRKVTPVGTNWEVTTFAGLAFTSGTNDGVGSAARFDLPADVVVDSTGNLYLADTYNNEVRKVTSAAVVRTLAGTAGIISSAGSSDGVGSAARFNYPYDLAVDIAGNLYVADTHNNTIRQISPAGEVFTMAGIAGISGTNDGTGNNALFSNPEGVAVDSEGNVYVADTINDTIRKVTAAGVVTTIAGLAGIVGTNDGTGSGALFNGPTGVAVDSVGDVFVSDNNSTIREIKLVGTNWVVNTIAGLGGTSVAVDSAGSLYITKGDSILTARPVGNNWVVTTLAGGTVGTNDGMGSAAQFYNPHSVAVDSAGNVYVADTFSYTIRGVTPAGVVTTLAGQPLNYGTADGTGSAARFYYPYGVAVDSAGNIYVADLLNNTIRKGVFTAYGAANEVAYSPPAMNSSLTVTLLPPEAGGQWRFPWEVAWHNSGGTASNLVAGNYPVEFSTVSGWLVIPFNGTVGVTNNTVVTNQYYPTIGTVDTNNGGTLTVTLGPNPPSGAVWGFLGASSPAFPSGYSTNLAAGTYLITFATVNGRVTPPNLAVQIQAGQPTYLFENYLLAQAAPGNVYLPYPVPSANISDLTDYPFGFNGQLQTDVGYGSGVAVQANVVLTAAHLVFNDQTLSYVNQAYWYFQEEAGVYQPQPIAARGWYVLSGYAEQRTNDLEVYAPDTSTPQSRNLDVAALYFLSPVAGGGYGGYLPSDESPNTWLTSTALKMLVGYPVDGSEFGVTVTNGVMYQTDPQPYPLALSTDPVANQQVYTAPWFLSYPGNSGGPVYVQLNGYYYPAGVYLGTLYNGVTPYASAVRAIDGDVVNLITNAAALGDTGTNNSGGGVITIVPNQAINANNPGYVQMQLAPPAAVLAGAAWKLSGDPDSAYSTGTNYIRAVTTTNAIGVQFKTIAGWNLPTNQLLSVLPGQIASATAYYTVTNPVVMAGEGTGLGISGTIGTEYRLEHRTSLTSGFWLPVSTNTILTNGFNLLLPNPSTNGSVNFYRAVWTGQ